jgi:hypothetical protein
VACSKSYETSNKLDFDYGKINSKCSATTGGRSQQKRSERNPLRRADPVVGGLVSDQGVFCSLLIKRRLRPKKSGPDLTLCGSDGSPKGFFNGTFHLAGSVVC